MGAPISNMPGYTPPAPLPVPPAPPSYIGGVPFEQGGFYGQPTPQDVLPQQPGGFSRLALQGIPFAANLPGELATAALSGIPTGGGTTLGERINNLPRPFRIPANLALGAAPYLGASILAPETIPLMVAQQGINAGAGIGSVATGQQTLGQAAPGIGLNLGGLVAPELVGRLNRVGADEGIVRALTEGTKGESPLEIVKGNKGATYPFDVRIKETGQIITGANDAEHAAALVKALDQSGIDWKNISYENISPEDIGRMREAIYAARAARYPDFAPPESSVAAPKAEVAPPVEKPPVGPEAPKAALPAAAEGAKLPAPVEAAALEQTPLDRAILETTQALKSAEKLRPEQEAMFKQQRAAQMGAAEQAFQTGQGVGAAKSAAGGRFNRPTFEPLNLAPENEQAIRTEIDTTPKLQTGGRFQANEALDALKRGELPEPAQIKALNEVMGPDFTAAMLDKVPVSMWGHIVDAANLPRTILASVDLSAPFRQGIVLAPGHPKEFVSSFGAMLKAALNDKNALMYDEGIMRDPLYSRLLNAGLDHVKEYGTASVMKEEAFMSRLAEQFPVLGPLIRGSERAYVTFLNKLRWDTAYTIVKGWQESGRPITEEELHNLSLFLNNATGRGSLGKAASLGPSLNALFFSPRLLASRGQLVADVFRPTQSAVVRQQAMRDLAAFIGTGTGILSLIKLSGMGDVQMDPRSSDFGKIQLGNTRIDFWGGFQPIVRYAAQLAPVQGKFAGTKVIQGSNGNVVVPADWGHTFSRFIRSKLAPIPSGIVDVQQGQDFLGNPVGKESFTSPDRQNPVIQRMAPLAFQDLADAMRANGFAGVATGAAGALGLGVSTQEKNPKFLQQADKEQASQRLQKSGFQPIADKFTEYEDARKAYLDKAGSADDPAARQARATAAQKWDKANAKYLPSLHQKALTFWTPRKTLLKQLYDGGLSWDALGLTPTEGKKLLGIK